MARIAGRAGSWLWWLAGALCALAFGIRTRGGEPVPQPPYGVVPRPDPRFEQPAVSQEQKDEAENLVKEYLAPIRATRPDAEEAQKLDALLDDLGSSDAARQRAAVEGLAELGTAALDALRNLKTDDNRAAARSVAEAARRVETEARKKIVERLAPLGQAARLVVEERLGAATKAGEEAGKAFKDWKTEFEARDARGEVTDSERRGEYQVAHFLQTKSWEKEDYRRRVAQLKAALIKALDEIKIKETEAPAQEERNIPVPPG